MSVILNRVSRGLLPKDHEDVITQLTMTSFEAARTKPRHSSLLCWFPTPIYTLLLIPMLTAFIEVNSKTDYHKSCTKVVKGKAAVKLWPQLTQNR